jgi:exodeoxyribonuclease VIII
MRAVGIYNNLDINEYHSEEGISSTGISLILDCPKRYYYEYKESKEETISKKSDKFKIGRAVHLMVLEPKKFDETFYLMHESVNLTTKVGKEAYAQAEIKANGRDILRKGEWEEIVAMAESIKQHSIWDGFKDALVEQSIFWDGGIYNTRLRARPDIFNEKIVMDIKTTDSIANFSKSLYNYGYHRQAAMQVDGLKSIDGKDRHFAFFVVEKKAPYLTACFTMDAASLNYGRQQYLDGAAMYAECMRTNIWPGYAEEVQLITLPSWITNKESSND